MCITGALAPHAEHGPRATAAREASAGDKDTTTSWGLRTHLHRQLAAVAFRQLRRRDAAHRACHHAHATAPRHHAQRPRRNSQRRQLPQQLKHGRQIPVRVGVDDDGLPVHVTRRFHHAGHAAVHQRRHEGVPLRRAAAATARPAAQPQPRPPAASIAAYSGRPAALRPRRVRPCAVRVVGRQRHWIESTRLTHSQPRCAHHPTAAASLSLPQLAAQSITRTTRSAASLGQLRSRDAMRLLGESATRRAAWRRESRCGYFRVACALQISVFCRLT